MPDIDYYGDDSQWGNYQFDTIEKIVNDYMAMQHPDDYSSTTPRYMIVYYARQGLKELYFDVLQQIKAIELEMSPSLTVIMPPDLVNYVRISWVDERGLLHPMAVNNNMSIATAYLQDNEFEILFDENGCTLQGTGVRDTTTVEDRRIAGCYSVCRDSYTSFRPNVNRSNHYPNGYYRVDKDRGVIEFSADAKFKTIVLEYISDGLFDGCGGANDEEIRIHKFARKALTDYISYELTKNRKNVPAIEKKRARVEFFNSRRIAIRRLNTMRKTEMLQAMKGSTRWIKPN